MLVLHERRRAGSFTIKQTVRTTRVETQDPIAHDLKCHAAHFGGFAASCAVINRRNREKPARLGPVLREPGQRPQVFGVEIIPQSHRCRHGEPPSVRQYESDICRFGNPP